MPILTSGKLINEFGPKDNPRETEYFENQVQFTDPDDFCEHVRWYLEGDIPEGILIDETSGLISGEIKSFDEQPSCQDNHPEEELEFDGSNWEKTGRFKHDTYDFNFTINREVTVSKCEKTLIETSDVIITEVKCQSIDAKIFIKKYLESTKTSSDGLTHTSIIVNGNYYTGAENVDACIDDMKENGQQLDCRNR